MRKHPLGEVFGYPIESKTLEAKKSWEQKLCPFGDAGAKCTKDKVKDPLGVCSVIYSSAKPPTITCPIRFKESHKIASDAAHFFFPEGTKWKVIPEVRLTDADNRAAGNIDMVLVSLNVDGSVADFGCVEIQYVYISGNVRKPFDEFMRGDKPNSQLDWTKEDLYPRPDFLSSSRKRLVPQLMYKGGILSAWGKKQAVVLDRAFLDSLPPLKPVSQKTSDLAWLVYELKPDEENEKWQLMLDEVIYTSFAETMTHLSIAEPGPLSLFEAKLAKKVEDL